MMVCAEEVIDRIKQSLKYIILLCAKKTKNEVDNLPHQEEERNRGRGAITPNYRYWPYNWLLKADNAKEKPATEKPDYQPNHHEQ